MSKAVHLKNTLPAICNAITGEKGIKLVWNGPPRTDGKTIYTNPLPAQADEDTVMMVTGDIDHECAHILFTDFDELMMEIARMPCGAVMSRMLPAATVPAVPRKERPPFSRMTTWIPVPWST